MSAQRRQRGELATRAAAAGASSAVLRRRLQQHGEQRAAAAAATAQPIFLFPNGATQPGLKPAVMVRTIIIGSETGGDGPSITNELNPTPPKTGGDSYFEPTVMGGAGVVFQTRFVIKLCNKWQNVILSGFTFV